MQTGVLEVSEGRGTQPLREDSKYEVCVTAQRGKLLGDLFDDALFKLGIVDLDFCSSN